MERRHRRKTSAETRFELNAVFSVFNNSRAVFLNRDQQQQVLAGKIPLAASFSYSQDISDAFGSDASSEVPPVHELFAGFIGPYQYLIPLNPENDCGAMMPVNEPRSPSSEAHKILTREEQPTVGQENHFNWGTVNVSKKSELQLGIIDRERFEVSLVNTMNSEKAAPGNR